MSQQNLWGFDPDQVGGKVGADHPQTSQQAAMTVKSGSQKAQAIKALAATHPNGLTAFQLSEHILNSAQRPISPNQAATRVGELHDQGLAAYLFDEVGRPQERETTPSNTGQVHILTKQGHQVAVNLKLEGADLQSESMRQHLRETSSDIYSWVSKKYSQ